jgi:hypothetical protein
MRDAENMFNRHDTATMTARPAEPSGRAHTGTLADPSVPMQADCCPARPMFKIVMPPTVTRPRPVDLWLCGHHYRASRAALKSAGANVCLLAGATDFAVAAGRPAGVAH